MSRAAALVAIVLLTVLLAYQWAGWSPQAAVGAYLRDSAPDAGDPGPVLSLPEPRPLPPLERFAVVTERPLFTAERRPPAEDPAPEAGAVTRPPLQLAGIVAVQDTYRVLARPPQGEPVRLAVGDEYQGWRVTEIGPERLVLTRDGRSEAYELRPAAPAGDPRRRP